MSRKRWLEITFKASVTVEWPKGIDVESLAKPIENELVWVLGDFGPKAHVNWDDSRERTTQEVRGR